MPKSQDLLTTNEFAKKTGMTPSTISKWLRSGKLKGEKISGKWMIPAELAEKKETPAPTQPATRKATVVKPQVSAIPPQNITRTRVYSVEEFSSMTYLTPFGVQQWLKTGRLKGQKDDAGRWGVDASNLDSPDVKRLLR